MKDIQNDPELELQTLVSGMHLSPDFGLTYHQIEKDGFKIDEKIEILLSSDTAVGVAKSVGLGVLGFCDALYRLSPDMLIILGDRFEALAAAQTAMLLRIPVVHLHGGEITEGAYDDAIRHAITKLSYLHFTATEEYRQRVIQLGEDPERVKNVGAIGLEHLRRTQLMTLQELSDSLGFDIHKPYFLVTYHPTTLAIEPIEQGFQALLKALDAYSNYQVIFTYPNADDGGRLIISLLESYAKKHSERVLAIPSLGQVRYLTALKYAAAVIGNSSSGIIEAPSYCVPTVNIGQRQQGRLAALSVFHCGVQAKEIEKAIRKSLEMDYKHQDNKVTNPYDQGNASYQIIETIKKINKIEMKVFYDLNCREKL